MIVLASRRRTLLKPSSFNPLSIGWHTAFWASDPAWTPPADGGAVSTWRDASGNGRNATQATGSKQPTYRAAAATMNNRPVVEFDGVDDFLRTATFTQITQPNEIAIVVRYRSLAAGRQKLIDGNATARHLVDMDSTSGSWRLFAGAVLTGGTRDTSKHLFRAVFDTTDALFIDGVSTISGDAGSEGLIDLVLAIGNNEVADPGPVDIAFVGLSDAPLTAQQRTDLLAWARSFYGTP